MSCPGLHCAGCGSAGAAVPVVPLAAVFGFAWVADHLIAVAAVSAVCGALAVAAVVALMRWTERREARFAAERPLLYARSEVIGSGTRVPIPQATENRDFLSPTAERPAIENHYHVHLDPADREAVRIIRTIAEGK